MQRFVQTESESVMTATELDFALASFWEFARIWRSGKKCKLVLSCDGGVGDLQLVAGLGAAEEDHFPPQVNKQQRRKKTPSQVRREERRRNERQGKKVGAEVEAVEASKDAEESKDTEKSTVYAEKANEVVSFDSTEVIDEVCPDTIYNPEEVDPAEVARNKMVEKIIVCPVNKNWKVDKEEIENEIRDKLMTIDVEVKSIESKRTVFGAFRGSIVETSPVN